MKVKVGDTAPDFTLPDQDGNEISLSDFKGYWTLVYFYPRDDTPGCTKEALAFRDNFARLKRAGARVIGISPDTVKSHDKFRQKHELPFILGADVDRKTVRRYGVWGKKKFMGREYMGVHRQSVLITPDGCVAKVYTKVKPETHAIEVLADIKELKRAR